MKSILQKKSGILLLSWVIPGYGYYYLGRKWQGILLFYLLFISYFSGMVMADFQNVSLGRNPHYLIAQIFMGGFTLVSLLVTHSFSDSPIWYPYGHYVGCLYCCIASLLNLLIILKLYSELTDKQPSSYNGA